MPDPIRSSSGALRRGLTLRQVQEWQPAAGIAGPSGETPVFNNAINLLSHGVHLIDVVRTCAAHGQASASTVPTDCLAHRCASLGGKSQSNAERDFHRMITDEFGGSLQPYTLWLPLLTESNSTTWDWEPVPCILISEFLHFISQQGYLQTHVSLLGEEGMEGVRHFWTEARTCETLQDVCTAALPDSVPLLIHYDGIGTFRNHEHDVWSWSSALIYGARGSIFDNKFPRLILDHSRIPGFHAHWVHQIIADFTAWEQDVLLEGRQPCHGFYNEELQRPWTGQSLQVKACIFGWQGDFKARMEAFGFRWYYRTKRICDSCEAMACTKNSDPTLSYKNFADDAQWRRTKYSDEELLQQPSGMWQIRGFRHAQAFRDELHLLPGGITKLVVANVVLHWDETGMLAAWAANRGLQNGHPMDALWDDYRAWLKRHSVKNRSTRSFFTYRYLNKKAGEQPEVASWVAAEHVKSCANYLAHVSPEIPTAACTRREDRIIKIMLWKLYLACQLIDRGPMWLQRRPRETLQRLVRDFLQAYQLLAQKAVEDGRLRWAVRPKMHYLDEAVSDLSKLHLNPKVTACWASEKWLGKNQEFHQEYEVRPPCHPAWPAKVHCVLAGAIPRQARIFSAGDDHECD